MKNENQNRRIHDTCYVHALKAESEIASVQTSLEFLIVATPTSEARNKLTEANILLEQARLALIRARELTGSIHSS